MISSTGLGIELALRESQPSWSSQRHTPLCPQAAPLFARGYMPSLHCSTVTLPPHGLATAEPPCRYEARPRCCISSAPVLIPPRLPCRAKQSSRVTSCTLNRDLM